ncbi:MAG: hypothetical protein KA165_05860 [Saprospiraceae bacterium]|nr:hypothetical protein [Saprospiraceae bacterium]
MPITQEVILDDDNLLRRVVFLDPNHIKEDGTPTSLAFKWNEDEDGLSVDVERLTTYEQALLKRERYRLFRFKAKHPRFLQLECVHNPQEDNYAHALIIGKCTKAIARNLAANSVRIPYPD